MQFGIQVPGIPYFIGYVQLMLTGDFRYLYIYIDLICKEHSAYLFRLYTHLLSGIFRHIECK